MSEDNPEWRDIRADDSIITGNTELNLLIAEMARSPTPHLDDILANGMDTHPAAEQAEKRLKACISRYGDAQQIWIDSVLFRAWDHIGIQLQKVALPDQEKRSKALVKTDSPADLVELAREFYAQAESHYSTGMETIWRKLQTVTINPEARAYGVGETALEYLAAFGTRRHTEFAHTIKEIHSTMMEYLSQLSGVADYHEWEFEARQLIRKAYKTAQIIDRKFDLERSAPRQMEKTQRTEIPYDTVKEIESPLTLEEDPRRLPNTAAAAETVDMPMDSNPYADPDAIFGDLETHNLSAEILTADGKRTVTMYDDVPDAEPERATPDAETKRLPGYETTVKPDADTADHIDPKAETIIAPMEPEPEILTTGPGIEATLTMEGADKTAPMHPNPTGKPDETYKMHYRKAPPKKIPEMRAAPRIWRSQAELMEHYFPFLLRDAEEDQPGRPADEIYVPEVLDTARNRDGFECTVRLGRKGEYRIILTDEPRKWHNHNRRVAPLTQPKAYVTTHYEKTGNTIKTSACIGGQWEDFQFTDPDYDDDPLTLDDI